MKKGEIKVGGHYRARISGNLVTVRVEKINRQYTGGGNQKLRTVYHVFNLDTGRRTQFNSVMKFCQEVPEPGEDKHPKLNVKGTQTGRSSSLSVALSKPKDKTPHLIIEARAGCGKTTTLIEGLKILKGIGTELVPSEQQASIWNEMRRSEGIARTICFVAFNKSIATELQERVPEGCSAMTMHSMGYRAVRDRFGSVKINNYRVQDIIAELLGKDIRELRGTKLDMIRATEKLVNLCKMNLTGIDNINTDLTDSIISRQSLIQEFLPDLSSHYDIDLNGNQTEVFDLVPRVLERCKDVNKDGCIDFSDMVWLPVALDLTMIQYDLLLVDEAQDLNRCQQELAMKAGDRLILCGDPKQAIYGFAGSDSKSIDRMMKTLSLTDRGCDYRPLTVTRRCGKAIVREAQKLVPDFEAHETCCEGILSHAQMQDTQIADDPNRCKYHALSYRSQVKAGDMILCRVNAPLVSECFKFLREGRKANIQGRDVGQGLISTIKKLTKESEKMREDMKSRALQNNDNVMVVGTEVAYLSAKLSDWLHLETLKEQAKRNPSESRLIALQDRYDCITCFMEGQETVEMVIKRIEGIFTDDRQGDGIKLSSVHKAKGLEADRVFILQPEGATIPHPMASTPWQVEQEWNILYIAITRAKKELVHVS